MSISLRGGDEIVGETFPTSAKVAGTFHVPFTICPCELWSPAGGGREIRPSGSEGRGTETNRFSLPQS